jgi:hypothetical protein
MKDSDGNRRKTPLDPSPLHPGGFFEKSRSLSEPVLGHPRLVLLDLFKKPIERLLRDRLAHGSRAKKMGQ